ncbi:hypothetical protein ZZ1p0199 [Acinetobacter phage ZZ1]|jgi:hypothetical protein|uniref:Uncharacterized protein n=2 Tax=Caudoviricetes TaxID=2731619 RepID=I3WW69_9CAUD|nr:hypothetical protein ZZ1p0199 [Acinetobacter phage ZZ1]AFL47739.1 hypothetical protein ZZ1p0199 [Acinetobacter phage ZZ1]
MAIPVVQILSIIAPVFFKKRNARIQEELKHCDCPCHDQGVYISHFVPCCKNTDVKKKAT